MKLNTIRFLQLQKSCVWLTHKKPDQQLNTYLAILALCFCLMNLPSSAAGQMTISSEYHRGFLLPHRQNMLHLPIGPAHCFELRIAKNTSGDKLWHRLYDRPTVGLTIRGFDLANRNVLGYGLGAAGFISSPTITCGRFSWHLEMGAGLGALTKKFDFDENYKNIAIGSNLNAFIFLGQRFQYRFTDSWSFVTSMSFNHFSNAAYALPNLGVNYPQISVGAEWSLNGNSENRIDADTTSNRRLDSYNDLSLSFGVKEATISDDKKYTTIAFNAQRVFGVSKKSALSAGVDWFYNPALTGSKKYISVVDELVNTQFGFRVGYQMHVDRLVISLHNGVYLYDQHKTDGLLYHRAGLRYYLSDHWGINLSLKTHFFKADYFELGTAFRF